MINFDLINLTALAKACEVNDRTLRAAVKTFQEGGGITPTLMQAMQYLRDHTNFPYAYDELLTEQMIAYMNDLMKGLGWTQGHVLSVALLDFWHSKDIVRCPKCEAAAAYPPEILVMDDIEFDTTCYRCGNEFHVSA